MSSYSPLPDHQNSNSAFLSFCCGPAACCASVSPSIGGRLNGLIVNFRLLRENVKSSSYCGCSTTKLMKDGEPMEFQQALRKLVLRRRRSRRRTWRIYLVGMGEWRELDDAVAEKFHPPD